MVQSQHFPYGGFLSWMVYFMENTKIPNKDRWWFGGTAIFGTPQLVELRFGMENHENSIHFRSNRWISIYSSHPFPIFFPYFFPFFSCFQALCLHKVAGQRRLGQAHLGGQAPAWRVRVAQDTHMLPGALGLGDDLLKGYHRDKFIGK